MKDNDILDELTPEDSEIKQKIAELREDNEALEDLLPDDDVQEELDRNLDEIQKLKTQFENIRLSEEVDEEDYDMAKKKSGPVSDEIVDVVGLMPKDWLYKEGGKTEHYKYAIIVSRENAYRFKKGLEKLGYGWDSYDEKERYANIHFGLTPSQYKNIKKNSNILKLAEEVEEYGMGGFVVGAVLGGYVGYKIGVLRPQRAPKDLMRREKKIIKGMKKGKKGKTTPNTPPPEYTEYEDVTYEKNYAKGGKTKHWKDDKYWADYTDIGIYSMDRNWSNSISEEEFYKIGKDIVDTQFKGDIGNAWDSIVKGKPIHKFRKGRHFRKGGETFEYDPNIDYFSEYELLPKDIYNAMMEEGELEDYRQTEKLLQKLEEKGWTFEYGLGNDAYDLRPIMKSEKYGSEYKKSEYALYYRPIDSNEEWSEVSDEAFDEEERKEFDKEMESIFREKVNFAKGGRLKDDRMYELIDEIEKGKWVKSFMKKLKSHPKVKRVQIEDGFDNTYDITWNTGDDWNKLGFTSVGLFFEGDRYMALALGVSDKGEFKTGYDYENITSINMNKFDTSSPEALEQSIYDFIPEILKSTERKVSKLKPYGTYERDYAKGGKLNQGEKIERKSVRSGLGDMNVSLEKFVNYDGEDYYQVLLYFADINDATIWSQNSNLKAARESFNEYVSRFEDDEMRYAKGGELNDKEVVKGLLLYFDETTLDLIKLYKKLGKEKYRKFEDALEKAYNNSANKKIVKGLLLYFDETNLNLMKLYKKLGKEKYRKFEDALEKAYGSYARGGKVSDLEVTSIKYQETRRGISYIAQTNKKGVKIVNDGFGGATFVEGVNAKNYRDLTEQRLESLIDDYESKNYAKGGSVGRDYVDFDDMTFSEFYNYLQDKDEGDWDNVNSEDIVRMYIDDMNRDDINVSHIEEVLENNPSRQELYEIWLGNSMNTPIPINTKEELVEALGLDIKDYAKGGFTIKSVPYDKVKNIYMVLNDYGKRVMDYDDENEAKKHSKRIGGRYRKVGVGDIVDYGGEKRVIGYAKGGELEPGPDYRIGTWRQSIDEKLEGMSGDEKEEFLDSLTSVERSVYDANKGEDYYDVEDEEEDFPNYDEDEYAKGGKIKMPTKFDEDVINIYFQLQTEYGNKVPEDLTAEQVYEMANEGYSFPQYSKKASAEALRIHKSENKYAKGGWIDFKSKREINKIKKELEKKGDTYSIRFDPDGKRFGLKGGGRYRITSGEYLSTTYDTGGEIGGKIGDNVIVETDTKSLWRGKKLKGEIVSLSPFKIRTGPTSTSVIPDKLIKSVKSYAKGGEVEDRVFSTDKYGEVIVRNAMFDIDGTNLEEGIEIKGDDIELTEIMGYYYVDDLDIEEVEELLDKYEGNELYMNDDDDYYTEEYAKGGIVYEVVGEIPNEEGAIMETFTDGDKAVEFADREWFESEGGEWSVSAIYPDGGTSEIWYNGDYFAKGGKIKMYDELQEYENDAQIGDKIYVGYGLAKKNITKPEYEVVGKDPYGKIKVRNYGSKAKKTFFTFSPQSYDEQVMVFSKGGSIKGTKVVRFYYDVYNNPNRYKNKNAEMYGDKDDPYRIAFEKGLEKAEKDKKDGTYEFFRGKTPSKLNFAEGGVITIGNSSHTTQEQRNREAFDLLNEKLISDTNNPLYDDFQSENLFLDDTNGFISIVSNHITYEPNSDKERDFLQYLKTFLSMNGGENSNIYIGDNFYNYHNYLKPEPIKEEYDDDYSFFYNEEDGYAKGGTIEGLKNQLKDVEKALENTEEGGEEYAVLQEEQHRLDSKISQMEFVSQLDPDSKNYNPKTETYLKRKGYAKGGEVFAPTTYMYGKEVELIHIYDENESDDWQDNAQYMIDSLRKQGVEAGVVHKGHLHGLYKEKGKYSKGGKTKQYKYEVYKFDDDGVDTPLKKFNKPQDAYKYAKKLVDKDDDLHHKIFISDLQEDKDGWAGDNYGYDDFAPNRINHTLKFIKSREYAKGGKTKKFDHIKNNKVVYDVWDKIVDDGHKGLLSKYIDDGKQQKSQFVFTQIEGVRTPDEDLDKFTEEVEKVLKKKGYNYDVNRGLGIVDIFADKTYAKGGDIETKLRLISKIKKYPANSIWELDDSKYYGMIEWGGAKHSAWISHHLEEQSEKYLQDLLDKLDNIPCEDCGGNQETCRCNEEPEDLYSEEMRDYFDRAKGNYAKGGDLQDKIRVVNKSKIDELENQKGKIESEIEKLTENDDYDSQEVEGLNQTLGEIYEEIRILSYGKEGKPKSKFAKGGKTEPNSGDFFKEEVDEYGYSYSNYKNGEWEKIYNFLIKEGNSREETKEIMLSKHTRWALDEAGSEEGTLKDFKKYYKKYKGKWFDKGGTVAEMYEIIDVSENNKFDSVISFDDLLNWTKELAFTQSLESPSTIKDAQDVLAKNNLIAVEFGKGGSLGDVEEDIKDLKDSLQWLSGQDKRDIELEILRLKRGLDRTTQIKATKKPKPKKKKQSKEELLEEIESDMSSFSRRVKGSQSELNIENNRVVFETRYLGNWSLPEDVDEDDEEYQDYDWEEWDDYGKYYKIFEDWAKSQKWYKKVNLDLDVSEKNWVYFTVILK